MIASPRPHQLAPRVSHAPIIAGRSHAIRREAANFVSAASTFGRVDLAHLAGDRPSAEVISAALLAHQAPAPWPPRSIPRCGIGPSCTRSRTSCRPQLDIGVAGAFVRIRAHEYTGDRPINDVARDTVNRRLLLG